MTTTWKVGDRIRGKGDAALVRIEATAKEKAGNGSTADQDVMGHKLAYSNHEFKAVIYFDGAQNLVRSGYESVTKEMWDRESDKMMSMEYEGWTITKLTTP